MGKAGFKLAKDKGFQITFQSGYTVLVQFGFGYNCENQFKLNLYNKINLPELNLKSSNAEVAVLNKDGEPINLPQFGIDQTGGWKTPEEVVEILNWAKGQK